MEHTTPPADVIARLASLPLFAGVPGDQLEWMVAHGDFRSYAIGTLVEAGTKLDEMSIIISGRVAWYVERRGGWRKGGDVRRGGVVGPIPYSRFDKAPGELVVEEDSDALVLHRKHFPGLIAHAPDVTAALVHHMIDRSRETRTAELNDDRLQSIGRVASGLAHELNNPASAARRQAQSLATLLGDAEDAARDLAAARLSESQLAGLDTVRLVCAAPPPTRTALQAADREDDVSEWLARHGLDPTLAEPLAASDLGLEMLDRLVAEMPQASVRVVLRWVACSSAARRVAQEIASATARIHDLIGAVKGFAFMDRDAVPEDVDIARGLADTLAVLENKLRGKSIDTTIETAEQLPRIFGFGSELNQLWQNLIDNAIDAASTQGRVTITAASRGGSVVVRIADDGRGIPEEHQARIFDPFFTTKPVGQGIGLGLDLVRRIVERHNGDVDFTSKPGRTVFRVRLPITGARTVRSM